LGGDSLGDLPNKGSSRGGGSPNRNPHGGSSLNHPIGFYGWLTLDSRMFMPLWYPPVAIQFELTSKLPYWKLQYPTYTKDTDPDAHIKVFKKIIKVNGEIVEVNIINLFGFTLGSIHYIMTHSNVTNVE
jgi:hypothetical protein